MQKNTMCQHNFQETYDLEIVDLDDPLIHIPQLHWMCNWVCQVFWYDVLHHSKLLYNEGKVRHDEVIDNLT